MSLGASTASEICWPSRQAGTEAGHYWSEICWPSRQAGTEAGHSMPEIVGASGRDGHD